MVSVCTVPARGGRSCEHFGGYKTINRIPFYLYLLRRFQQLRSYRDEIETRNREEIPYSSRKVPRGLSVAEGP